MIVSDSAVSGKARNVHETTLCSRTTPACQPLYVARASATEAIANGVETGRGHDEI